jgi:hypothetical protein
MSPWSTSPRLHLKSGLPDSAPRSLSKSETSDFDERSHVMRRGAREQIYHRARTRNPSLDSGPLTDAVFPT